MVKTLRDAIILVGIVVLVFLQNWRATVIPLIAVPVAIVGTFSVMSALGFSINNISLFGLVLAIGIVVDDAIVVVENVERWLEQGMSSRDAARRAMDEVTGPVVAVALVLCAVFVPCAFISGITGQFFRQFAVTIAISTVFSAFNSLTLSPALASILLKPHTGPPAGTRQPLPGFAYAVIFALVFGLLIPPYLQPALAHVWPAAASYEIWLVVACGVVGCLAGWLLAPGGNFLLSIFFRGFNWFFELSTALYTSLVGWLLRLTVVVLLVYGALLYLTYWGVFQMAYRVYPSAGPGLVAGECAIA